MDRLQAMEEVEKLGKIVFRAVNTKRQQAIKIGPLQDKTGKLFTGQGELGYFESLTPKDKDQLGVVFDHSTVYTVEDGKVLDLDDPYDRALWQWIKKHPYIGATREECSINRDAVFYIDNPEKKAKDYVSKDKKIVKTKTLIYNAPAEQQVAVAKALGLVGSEGQKPVRIEEWLILKAESMPDTITELLSPDKAGYTTALGMLNEMLTYNVIKRFGTVYKYGGREGIDLGTSEDQVAQWLTDTKHEDTVLTMQYALDEEKGLV